jgi:hypothetical protein
MELGLNPSTPLHLAQALALLKTDFTLLVADINGRTNDHLLLKEFNMATILLRHGGEEERLKQALTKSGHVLVSKPVRGSELYEAVSRALNPFQSGTSLLGFCERLLISAFS